MGKDLTENLKRDGCPVRFFLMVNDDLIVTFAGDEFAILKSRRHKRDTTLRLVGVVVL